MSPSRVERPWDFSSVYDMLNSGLGDNRELRNSRSKEQDNLARHTVEPADRRHEDHPASNTTSSTGLGDFSRIWQFLGAQNATQASAAQALSTSPNLQRSVPGKIEYTSDGAAYSLPSMTRKIQWRDEINEGALTDVAPTLSDAEPSTLSQKQRKKLNKNTRRAVSDMESEAEMPASTKSPAANPAAKASVHSLPINIPTKHSSKSSSAGKTAMPHSSPDDVTSKARAKQGKAVAVPSSNRTNLPEESEAHDVVTLQKVADSGRKYLARYNSEPPESRMDASENEKPSKKEWPVSKPFSKDALSFLPALVRPRAKPAAHESSKPTEQAADSQNAKIPASASRSDKQIITPKIIRSGEDRHWAFLLKLINNFWEDRASLVHPANLSNHSSNPSGIHVFVDASNIFIGFHDQLKRARGIPATARVPRVDMSFDALALLMERRRPVAKRILAGSTPLVPAFEVARSVGYECSILDKVYKARELTDRQRYFLEQDAKAARKASPHHGRRRSGGGSGSGRDNGYSSDGYVSGGSAASYGSTGGGAGPAQDKLEVPTHAPLRYVEQGVDEVLHLKILESIVDASEAHPPSTIVLATGDAAQAEYSDGFMRMVERALGKGWRVELVSWSANISGMYKRSDFRRKWGEKFRVIELDDYAEELLDM